MQLSPRGHPIKLERYRED
uniref:Auxin-induced protein 6B-like n=1 Tax=Rhizophora mucronata TaxID=61149 RepID=A0A2P2JN88_RHIMU